MPQTNFCTGVDGKDKRLCKEFETRGVTPENLTF